MIELITNIEFWKYLSIPFVAGIVGWGTNWVAIKMLFYPIEPFGRPPYLGWQGILPSKAEKMGAITADTTLSKLGTTKEVFEAMEPDIIASHLVDTIYPRIDDYIEWIMLEENPEVWELLPSIIKNLLIRMVRNKLPEIIKDMMNELGENIDQILDLKHTVIVQLQKEKRIVNRIFLECGSKEFAFIIKSGFYFGFIFGLIQMSVWYFYPAWWILPFFGIIVGFATNWIALRIIFQPLTPKKIGPFILHGLFLKRQREVADIWCEIITEEIITIRNIINDMLTGPNSEYTQRIIRKHIRNVVDEAVGLTKPLIQFTVGVKEYMKIKETATEKAIFATTTAFDDPVFNKDRAKVVKTMIQQRMETLSSEEFQHLLRPAFQEDELKLIILGAVLGFGAGIAQLFFIFGGMGT
jgi:uncharacterized membrane protein YheB (UPF0754 family)